MIKVRIFACFRQLFLLKRKKEAPEGKSPSGANVCYESAEGGPLLRGAVHAEAVTIGRFHNVPIVPRAGGYIGEGLVALYHSIGVGAAAQDTVDHDNGFRAGVVEGQILAWIISH